MTWLQLFITYENKSTGAGKTKVSKARFKRRAIEFDYMIARRLNKAGDFEKKIDLWVVKNL